jgi:hypothetical protein
MVYQTEQTNDDKNNPDNEKLKGNVSGGAFLTLTLSAIFQLSPLLKKFTQILRHANVDHQFLTPLYSIRPTSKVLAQTGAARTSFVRCYW